MSLKVMCAGCSVEERERAESDVRRALGALAAGGETWIVSVINLQSRWSVTLDGPGIRALNCTAPPGRLAETIQEALQRTGAPPGAAAPSAGGTAPAAAAALAARPAVPAPSPVLPAAGRGTNPPSTARPTAPAPPRSAPLRAPAAGNSASAGPRSAISPASGPRRDRHECVQCHQRFGVMFEAVAGEPEHMTPVACPHCWHMNHVLVGETAADTSDYRAEKD